MKTSTKLMLNKLNELAVEEENTKPAESLSEAKAIDSRKIPDLFDCLIKKDNYDYSPSS